MTPPDPLLTQLADLRTRLVALAAAHAHGELDDDAYETARRAAERALSDAVLAAPSPPPAVPKKARPSTGLVLSLVVVIVVIALGGYAFTGAPSLAGLGKPPATAPAEAVATSERENGLAQIAAMVDKLAARLKEHPDDAEGWTMLARSYTVLTRYRDALPAYRRALELQPANAGLMADAADAIAAANSGKPDAESTALIDRALVIDPKQPKALALSGTLAFDRGDFATAVRQWQVIADALPPDSEFHQQVVANIDEARRRGNLPPGPTARLAAPPAAPATSPTPVAKPAGGAEALTGTVTLSPALAAKAAPDDTVFVLARPENGRMPLAVFRSTVRELPLRFRLDDSMAMTPTMKISDLQHVVVAARVSKSGNAITQPGDLSGQSPLVTPGTRDLAIVIDQVAP